FALDIVVSNPPLSGTSQKWRDRLQSPSEHQDCRQKFLSVFACNGLRRWCELMNVPSTEPELRTLMIAGLGGDAAAHRTLLERLSRQLRGYYKGHLDRVGGGPVEAEDLVQEALMAIHTRRHTYDPSQPFTPWVYAIARYKFVDYLRRTRASAQDL